MRSSETRLIRRAVCGLAVASVIALSGCGGSDKPAEKNIKPGSNLSPEAEAKIKEMQATATLIKRDEDEPAKTTGKGATKKGAKKAGSSVPKGIIVRPG